MGSCLINGCLTVFPLKYTDDGCTHMNRCNNWWKMGTSRINGFWNVSPLNRTMLDVPTWPDVTQDLKKWEIAGLMVFEMFSPLNRSMTELHMSIWPDVTQDEKMDNCRINGCGNVFTLK